MTFNTSLNLINQILEVFCNWASYGSACMNYLSHNTIFLINEIQKFDDKLSCIFLIVISKIFILISQDLQADFKCTITKKKNLFNNVFFVSITVCTILFLPPFDLPFDMINFPFRRVLCPRFPRIYKYLHN